MMRRTQLTAAPPVVIRKKLAKASPTKAAPVLPSPKPAAAAKPPSTDGAEKPTLAKPKPVQPKQVQESPPVPAVPVVPIPAAVPTMVAVQEPVPEPTQPNKKERMRAEVAALLDVLADRFPSTFVRDRDRPIHPLAIGTRQALAALLPEEPKWKISRAINAYISRVRFEYLTALIAGLPRIDLEGKPGAVPTEEERERAKTELAEWQEKWRERRKQQASQRRLDQKKRQSGQVDQSGAAVPKQKAGKVVQSVRHDSAGA
jgi:sRNA-binding protein